MKQTRWFERTFDLGLPAEHDDHHLVRITEIVRELAAGTESAA